MHTHSQVSLWQQCRSCRRYGHTTLHISSQKTEEKITPKLLDFLFWEAKSLQCHPGALHPLRACLGLLSHQVICSCRWNCIHEHIHWTVHSSDTIHITYFHQHQSTRQSNGLFTGGQKDFISPWCLDQGSEKILYQNEKVSLRSRLVSAEHRKDIMLSLCALPFLLKYCHFRNGREQWDESTKITEINFQKK